MTGHAAKASEVQLSKEEILGTAASHYAEVALDGQEAQGRESALYRAGGLGSPLAMYLAAAGVGTIGNCDFDVVDYTNLHAADNPRHGDVGRLSWTPPPIR